MIFLEVTKCEAAINEAKRLKGLAVSGAGRAPVVELDTLEA